MKSEHRHELETNVLAKHLADFTEQVRPHATLIVAILGVAAGVALAASLWSQRQAARSRAAWDRYELALASADREYEDVLEVAADERYEGTAAQEWAYLAYADRQLLLAAEQYLIDRDQSQQRLDKIWGIYDRIAADGSASDLRNRARLGLARAYEMQNKLEESIQQYRLIDGALKDYAAERIEQLESKQAQTAYSWLSTAELPMRQSPSGSGTPGDRPDFNVEFPSTDSEEVDLDTSRSLEEILGGLGGDDQEDRYDEPGGTEMEADQSESGQSEADAAGAAAAEANPSEADPSNTVSESEEVAADPESNDASSEENQPDDGVDGKPASEPAGGAAEAHRDSAASAAQ